MIRNRESFICANCAQKNCDEDQSRPGSIGPAAYPRWQIEVGGRVAIESNTCLLPMLDSEALHLIELSQHFNQGRYIHDGGLYDQPHVYYEAMTFINGNQS